MKKRQKNSATGKPRTPSPEQWQAFEKAYEIEQTGDIAAARLAYERAARLGSPHAQINLSALYDEGKFGFRDRERAIALNKRAFKQGYNVAAYNIAQTYRMDNMRRWYLYWLRKAAELGDADAKDDLRQMGVPWRNSRKPSKR